MDSVKDFYEGRADLSLYDPIVHNAAPIIVFPLNFSKITANPQHPSLEEISQATSGLD